MKFESLKEKYIIHLLLVVLVNFVIFYLAVKTDSILKGDIVSLVQDWRKTLPGGAGFLIITIMNGVISSEWKFRLVFLKWNYPLPGSYAFSHYGKNDPRIDLLALENKFGELPSSPQEQNRLWYKMYHSIRNETPIPKIHKDFLFSRDYTGLSFLCLIFFGTGGFVLIPSTPTSILYLILLIVQYLVVRVAAKNYGVRLVTTVLAMNSARN